MSKHLMFDRISLQKPGIILKFFLLRLPMLSMSALDSRTDGLCSMSGTAPNHLIFSSWPAKDIKKAPHLNWFLQIIILLVEIIIISMHDGYLTFSLCIGFPFSRGGRMGPSAWTSVPRRGVRGAKTRMCSCWGRHNDWKARPKKSIVSEWRKFSRQSRTRRNARVSVVRTYAYSICGRVTYAGNIHCLRTPLEATWCSYASALHT